MLLAYCDNYNAVVACIFMGGILSFSNCLWFQTCRERGVALKDHQYLQKRGALWLVRSIAPLLLFILYITTKHQNTSILPFLIDEIRTSYSCEQCCTSLLLNWQMYCSNVYYYWNDMQGGLQTGHIQRMMRIKPTKILFHEKTKLIQPIFISKHCTFDTQANRKPPFRPMVAKK